MLNQVVSTSLTRPDRKGFINGNRPLLDSVCQGRTFDEFEDERLVAVGLFESMYGCNVRVVQTGENFSFPFKPGQSIRIVRKGLWQDFQRHVPVELGISGSIHLPHAAFADLGGDGVRAEPGAAVNVNRFETPSFGI